MRFRPCIDIHDGQVKQIVGSTISDLKKGAVEPKTNYIADKDASYFASLYKRDGLYGGHIINLNQRGTDAYNASKDQAIAALRAFPGGMQYGGGVNDTNAKEFIEAGASHVIVTSFVFNNGRVDYDALEKISNLVGREHLVLDLSCTRVDDKYVIVTDRWQTVTKEIISYNFLDRLSDYCDEFLFHAADVEGRQSGIDRDLVGYLSGYKKIPITYAGGVSEYGDIDLISYLSDNTLDFTVGSSLDLFGGDLSYDRIVSGICG
ncbi:MAG: phosphoribosylformimino-5-aminoimidazole carboxamide ribotide isomerase [Pseudobutyrivibrio sp.]|nr:phosphoribosylformimino-5-aminoimidazole carboxamide ribotide isomerase [Pseudobutyrivibrio sp.]